MAEDKVTLNFTSSRTGVGLTQVLVFLDGVRVGDLLMNDRQLSRFDRFFEANQSGGIRTTGDPSPPAG